MTYIPIVGLEIHVELKTRSKMFCGCANDQNEKHPNINICPICMGHPGTLPVINREAVRKVIKTGLALHCQVLENSKFDRKNYFYPDLPKGYQISQYNLPLCKEGYLRVTLDNLIPPRLQKGRGRQSKIRIRRIHLEEDTGKLLHPEGTDYSLVDFNRAGIPLMELVTEPDIRSAKEARRFSEELRLILRYLGVSDADMEKGQMRVEVNLSLLSAEKAKQEIKSDKELGTKVEIKNLNSFRAVEGALEYEAERQTEVLESGKKVVQETRGWSENRGATLPQREKEEAYDYRYFPEPDLPPLRITGKEISEIQSEIPELPQQKRERFAKEYNLGERDVEVFVQNKDLGAYFEKVISELRDWIKSIELKTQLSDREIKRLVKIAANYILTDLQRLLKKASTCPPKFLKKTWEGKSEKLLITPENFAELIALIYEGKISSKIAKLVLSEMFETGADPSHIIKEKKLSLITDESEIKKIIKNVLNKNQTVINDFKAGKRNALQFLVGQVMQETRGRANPQTVKDLLEKELTNT